MTLSTEDSGLTRRGFVRAAAGAACALGGASAVLGDGPTNAQDKPAAPAPAPAPASKALPIVLLCLLTLAVIGVALIVLSRR